MKRTLMIVLCGMLGLLVLAGCHKDDAVDAPLMKNAPPPPPQPNKPSVSPTGGGGGAPKGTADAP